MNIGGGRVTRSVNHGTLALDSHLNVEIERIIASPPSETQRVVHPLFG